MVYDELHLPWTKGCQFNSKNAQEWPTLSPVWAWCQQNSVSAYYFSLLWHTLDIKEYQCISLEDPSLRHVSKGMGAARGGNERSVSHSESISLYWLISA